MAGNTEEHVLLVINANMLFPHDGEKNHMGKSYKSAPDIQKTKENFASMLDVFSFYPLGGIVAKLYCIPSSHYISNLIGWFPRRVYILMQVLVFVFMVTFVAQWQMHLLSILR